MRRTRFLAAAAASAAASQFPVRTSAADATDGLRLLRERGYGETPFARINPSGTFSLSLFASWTDGAMRRIRSGATPNCLGAMRCGERRAALYELDATPAPPLHLLTVWRDDIVTDVAATTSFAALAPTLPGAGPAPPAGLRDAAAIRSEQQLMMPVATAVGFALQARWPEHDMQNAFSAGSSPAGGSFTFIATRDEWHRLSPAGTHDVLSTLAENAKRLCGLTQPDRPERHFVVGIAAAQTPPGGATRQIAGAESPLVQVTIVPDRWAAAP